MFTSIDINNLLKKLYKAELTGSDYKIILCIMRYTLALEKEYTYLSYGFISDEIKTDESHIKKRIKNLQDKGILKNYKHPGALYNLWGFNQDFLYSTIESKNNIACYIKTISEETSTLAREDPGRCDAPGTKAEPMHQEKEPSSKASARQQPIKRSCTSATEEKSTLAPGTETKTKARARK